MGELTAGGYQRSTVDELKTEVRDRIKAAPLLGSGSAVGEGVLGELEEFVSITVDLLDKREQELEKLYASRYIQTASGEALQQAVAWAGLVILPAIKTTSDTTTGNQSTAAGVATTAYPAGSRVEILSSGLRLRTVAEVIIGGGGTIPVDMEQIEDPLDPDFIPTVFNEGDSVLGGELTFVDTVVGVDDLILGKLILGRKKETDEQLKVRHFASVGTVSGSILDSVIDKILSVGVTSVSSIENNTDFPDAEGRPPHRFEIVVDGGDTQEILDAIAQSKAEGIGTVGDISGTGITVNGISRVVNFSRRINTTIFMEIEIIKDLDKYPSDGDDLVKAEVEKFGTDKFTPFSRVLIVWDAFFGVVFNVPGILDVVVKGALVDGTETDTNLQLDFKAKPIFSQANIDVVTP